MGKGQGEEQEIFSMCSGDCATKNDSETSSKANAKDCLLVLFFFENGRL